MALDHLEDLVTATCLETLWQRHLDRMAEYGFDRLIYGHTNFRHGESLGQVDDFVILSNHGRQYLDRFFGEGLYFHGPMMRWALDNHGARSWKNVHELAAAGAFSDAERRVYDFNQSMDVIAGYTISFPTLNRNTKGAISLCARSGMSQDEVDAVWQEHGRRLELVNNVAHLKIISMPFDAPKRALTNRQREVLEWVGDGKTVQDIATLIGRTPATVEKHLRLAREAMDVETTAQALLKASFLHQLYRPDAN